MTAVIRSLPSYGITCLLLLALLPVANLAAASPATVKPTPGHWRAESWAFGQVSAVADSRIRLPFAVRITASAIIPGQTVRRGAVLLRFDAPRLHQDLAAYRDARHTVSLARERLAILRSSRKQQTLTRNDLIAGEQALATAQAAATSAWNRLQTDLAVLDTRLGRAAMDKRLDQDQLEPLQRRMGALYAPFDGVVATRPPPVGAWVNSGEPLLELEDLSRVYLRVGVPRSRLAAWRGWRQRGGRCRSYAVADAVTGRARHRPRNGSAPAALCRRQCPNRQRNPAA